MQHLEIALLAVLIEQSNYSSARSTFPLFLRPRFHTDHVLPRPPSMLVEPLPITSPIP
jgi:hypothetical protein